MPARHAPSCKIVSQLPFIIFDAIGPKSIAHILNLSNILFISNWCRQHEHENMKTNADDITR